MAETASPDLQQQANTLAQLDQDGAARFAPARFRYLDSLCQRLQQLPRPSLRSVQRLATAINQLQQDFEQQREQARSALAEQDASDADTALFSAGDFQALLRRLNRPTPGPSPFAALQDCYQQPPIEPADEGPQDPIRALLKAQEQSVFSGHGIDTAAATVSHDRHELRALRQVRANQHKVKKRRRIDDAIIHTPSDAGPLNSHRLVTRSIETLREISPAYLERFVGYVDTLMWLEKAGKKRG